MTARPVGASPEPSCWLRTPSARVMSRSHPANPDTGSTPGREIPSTVLRALATRSGSRSEASPTATDDRIGSANVFDAIANLAAKSLISTDITLGPQRLPAGGQKGDTRRCFEDRLGDCRHRADHVFAAVEHDQSLLG